MKVVVLNNSGNVGKSTIAREVFYANMEDAKLLEVETICSGNEKFKASLKDYERVQGVDMTRIYTGLMEKENVVVDVGASNIYDFFGELKTFAGVEEIIDMFILPTTKDAKQLGDTIKTVKILNNEFGIPMEKITVIANRVKLKKVREDFKLLFSASSQFGFNFNPDLVVQEREVLMKLELGKKTIQDGVNDAKDYPSLIAKEEDKKEKGKLIRESLEHMASTTLTRELREVYEAVLEI